MLNNLLDYTVILKNVVQMKRLQYYTWFIMFSISARGTASWYQCHYIQFSQCRVLLHLKLKFHARKLKT